MAIRVEFDEAVSRPAGGAAGIDVEGAATVLGASPSLYTFNCYGEVRSALRVTKDEQLIAMTTAVRDRDRIRLSV